jgi:hypothetical protein
VEKANSSFWFVLLAGLFIFGDVRIANATSCTPGTSCYCDRVRNGDLKDANLLLCEDFEAPTLNVPAGQEMARIGGGAPYFGPPYDDTGYTGNRGFNGYWYRTYSNGVNGCLWRAPNPNPATYGRSCNPGGSGICVGQGIWDPTDRWQANGFARAAFIADTEFGADEPNITSPTGRAGGGSGAFDGRVSYGQRVAAREVGGGCGSKNWPASRTIGITMAVAYSNNIFSTGGPAGILGGNWKHNEWSPGGTGMFMFGYANDITRFPFYSFFFTAVVGNVAACQASSAAAIKTAGSFSCDGSGNFIWFPTGYNFTTNWGVAKWGCVQGYYRNIGLSNMAWTVTFTGPSGQSQVIADISNFDGRFLQASGGIDGINFNNYANTNQDPTNHPELQTTQAVYRYEDNIHIRAGAPVSCAQIGFSSNSPSPAPSVDTTPPAVSITSPANGAIVGVRSTVAVTSQ